MYILERESECEIPWSLAVQCCFVLLSLDGKVKHIYKIVSHEYRYSKWWIQKKYQGVKSTKELGYNRNSYYGSTHLPVITTTIQLCPSTSSLRMEPCLFLKVSMALDVLNHQHTPSLQLLSRKAKSLSLKEWPRLDLQIMDALTNSLSGDTKCYDIHWETYSFIRKLWHQEVHETPPLQMRRYNFLKIEHAVFAHEPSSRFTLNAACK